MGRSSRTTDIFLTVDVELTPALHVRGLSCEDNYALSIEGVTPAGSYGLGRQLARLAEHRLKAVFFVEALSAHVYGFDILRRVVHRILEHDHEVQLHVHTEWLPYMVCDPVNGHRGHDMSDFGVEHQRVLIELGADTLEAVGAPRPTAFRAGNFGSNQDTLRAAKRAGLRFDASYNADRRATRCRIENPATLVHPLVLEDIIEFPMSALTDGLGRVRQASVRSLSVTETSWLFETAVMREWPSLVWLCHSFELISRWSRLSSPIMLERFERLCDIVTRLIGFVNPIGFNDLAPAFRPRDDVQQIPPRSGSGSTIWRMAEQTIDRILYD